MSDTDFSNCSSDPSSPVPPRDWLRILEDIPDDEVERGRPSWEDRARQAERRVDDAEGETERLRSRIEAMTRALESRAQIDQAKGVLMVVFGLGPDAAFEALVWVSQRANVRLATVAQWFIDDTTGVDFGAQHRDQITAVMAKLCANGPTRSQS